MVDSSLAKSLKWVFGIEKGYSNAKTDKGGPTNFGITQATLAAYRGHAVSAVDVQNLTWDEAEDIYRKNYWNQVGGDLLPAGLDYMAFDFGVNSGPSRAVKNLQTLLGVSADGSVGAKTLDAVNSYSGGLVKLCQDYADSRMKFLKSLGGAQGFSANGRGWTIRVTGVDPKGQWAKQPGVIGNAMTLIAHPESLAPVAAIATIPSPDTAQSAQAKAVDSSIGLSTILAKSDSITGLLSALGGLGVLVTGNGPIQWALAVAIVAGGGYFVYSKIKAVRAGTSQ